MDAFGFTKKKLLSLSKKNQHRHLIHWLSLLYQKLTTNRVRKTTLELFTCQYNQILSWTEMAPFIPPPSTAPRLWLETVSDRIQYHRTGAGAVVRDPDLLAPVRRTRDLPGPSNIPDMDCHVALDGLRSLFNVGAVFRTCDATGFSSVILGNTCGRENPKVRKTAMGSHLWVGQEKTGDLYETLMKKKKNGYTVTGVETVRGAVPYDETGWEKKTIIVFGNEEYGMSSHVIPACDRFVYLPMSGRKNSVNVAAAVSVVCFHAARFIGRSSPS